MSRVMQKLGISNDQWESHDITYSSIVWTSGPQCTEKEWYDAMQEDINGDAMRTCIDERNRKLAETDWWAMSDRTMTTEQTNYRQALRDIPQNIEAGNLTAPKKENGRLVFDWPDKP